MLPTTNIKNPSKRSLLAVVKEDGKKQASSKKTNKVAKVESPTTTTTSVPPPDAAAAAPASINECAICLDLLRGTRRNVVLTCGHTLHEDCLQAMILSQQKSSSISSYFDDDEDEEEEDDGGGGGTTFHCCTCKQKLQTATGYHKLFLDLGGGEDGDDDKDVMLDDKAYNYETELILDFARFRNALWSSDPRLLEVILNLMDQQITIKDSSCEEFLNIGTHAAIIRAIDRNSTHRELVGKALSILALILKKKHYAKAILNVPGSVETIASALKKYPINNVDIQLPAMICLQWLCCSDDTPRSAAFLRISQAQAVSRSFEILLNYENPLAKSPSSAKRRLSLQEAELLSVTYGFLQRFVILNAAAKDEVANSPQAVDTLLILLVPLSRMVVNGGGDGDRFLKEALLHAGRLIEFLLKNSSSFEIDFVRTDKIQIIVSVLCIMKDDIPCKTTYGTILRNFTDKLLSQIQKCTSSLVWDAKQALQNIFAYAEGNSSRLLGENNVYFAIVSAMHRHSSQAKLVIEALRILAVLTKAGSHNGVEQLCNKLDYCADLVATAMKTHSDFLEVQYEGITFILNLYSSGSSVARSMVSNAGGASLALNVLTNVHGAFTEPQEAVLLKCFSFLYLYTETGTTRPLYEVAIHPGAAAQIAKSIQHLVVSYKDLQHCLKLLRLAGSVLLKLVTNIPTFKEAFKASEGVECIRGAMTEIIGDSKNNRLQNIYGSILKCLESN